MVKKYFKALKSLERYIERYFPENPSDMVAKNDLISHSTIDCFVAGIKFPDKHVPQEVSWLSNYKFACSLLVHDRMLMKDGHVPSWRPDSKAVLRLAKTLGMPDTILVIHDNKLWLEYKKGINY